MTRREDTGQAKTRTQDTTSGVSGGMSCVLLAGMNTVTDPVCGMKVDPEKAVGSSMHEGQTYYFCSRGCEEKFDADPKKYTSADHKPAGMGRR